MITHDIDIRFRDIDVMGHVNNAVYATYLEDARDAYFREVIGEPLAKVDSAIVTMELEFRRAVEPDDDVTVTVEVGELGESTIPMEYEIRTGSGVAATGTTIQVALTEDRDSSRPLPDDWRDAIEAEKER